MLFPGSTKVTFCEYSPKVRSACLSRCVSGVIDKMTCPGRTGPSQLGLWVGGGANDWRGFLFFLGSFNFILTAMPPDRFKNKLSFPLFATQIHLFFSFFFPSPALSSSRALYSFFSSSVTFLILNHNFFLTSPPPSLFVSADI